MKNNWEHVTVISKKQQGFITSQMASPGFSIFYLQHVYIYPTPHVCHFAKHPNQNQTRLAGFQSGTRRCQ